VKNNMQSISESNWQKGVILTDSGETVAHPKMSLKQFLTTPLGASATVNEQSKGYYHAVIRSVMISGYECCVALYFHEDTLCECMIVVTEATAQRFGFVTGYAAPSGPVVAFLEGWVRREVGCRPRSDFDWGSVAAVYDSKGGFASITFIYS
jgi:hypothetical protein